MPHRVFYHTPVSTLSYACVRLDTCPERRAMKKQQRLEIASKEEKAKTGKFYGVLGSYAMSAG